MDPLEPPHRIERGQQVLPVFQGHSEMHTDDVRHSSGSRIRLSNGGALIPRAFQSAAPNIFETSSRLSLWLVRALLLKESRKVCTTLLHRGNRACFVILC
jgi:hypothetical protein